MAAGQTLYQANCLACHQADGRGVPGLNPPLAKSDWVAGDLARLVGVLLNGQQGPITVNGERYNGVMPKQAHLTNEELAQLLTYVRNSFGNQLGPVNLEQVQALRK
jgi:mono/diheme cytochrome c family protein